MEWLAAENLLEYGGFALLLAILFAESGLLFGLFLPGETLLLATGMLASSKYLEIDIVFILLLVNVATISGYATGYHIGRFSGAKLKDHHRFKFVKRYLPRTLAIFKNNQFSAMIWWRFIPFIRTFIPIAAGIDRMRFGKYMALNVLGSIFWTMVFVLPGYYFGHRYETVVNSLTVMVGLLLFILLLPFLKVYIHNRIKPILKRDYEKFHRWFMIKFQDRQQKDNL
jgi:membrane-associated protein